MHKLRTKNDTFSFGFTFLNFTWKFCFELLIILELKKQEAKKKFQDCFFLPIEHDKLDYTEAKKLLYYILFHTKNRNIRKSIINKIHHNKW